jgi:hypothetical protein
MPRIDAVYRELLDHIQSDLAADSPSVTADYVYLVAEPIFRVHDDRLVQVVPGVSTALHPAAGSGYCQEEVRIACWRRLWTDYAGASNDLISNNTEGLMALLGNVRDSMSGAVNADLTNLTVLPQFIRGSGVSMNDNHPGWGFVIDTYRIEYDLGWRQ